MRFWVYISLLFIVKTTLAQDSKLINKGDRAFKRGKYFDAIELYKEAQNEGSTYNLNQKIADTYYRVQDFRQAADYYLKLISTTKQKQEDYERLYLSYHYSGDQIKSAEILNLLYDYFPSFKQSKFYWWAISELSAPCVPYYGKKKKLNYCVTLDATSSIDFNNDKIHFKWEPDDGTKHYGPRLKHCFTESGKHDIKLTSIDSTNSIVRQSDTTLQVIFLDHTNFILAGRRQVGYETSFNAFQLTDSEDYFYMVWETGDGNVYFSPEAKHVYNMIGEYLVKLTVFGKDESGYIYPVACLTKTWVIGE